MSKKKLTVTPVITGIHPQKKRVFALHYHPDSIVKNVENLKEMSENEEMKNLFEDIETLVKWALPRLQLLAPPKEKASS